jgi:hypothetical protein
MSLMEDNKKKDYNINTLRGVTTFTDEEVCETLGIPMEYANTPKMIDAQLERDVSPDLHEEIKRSLAKYL